MGGTRNWREIRGERALNERRVAAFRRLMDAQQRIAEALAPHGVTDAAARSGARRCRTGAATRRTRRARLLPPGARALRGVARRRARGGLRWTPRRVRRCDGQRRFERPLTCAMMLGELASICGEQAGGSELSRLMVVEQEPADLELELLIREARHRQRRRRLRRARPASPALVIAGVAAVALTHWLPAATHNDDRAAPQCMSGATCSSSPARFVSNAVFDATVIGSGSVRLGVGNDMRGRARAWSSLPPSRPKLGRHRGDLVAAGPEVRGPITVRGVALGKQGPIEVQAVRRRIRPGRRTPRARPVNSDRARASAISGGLSPGRSGCAAAAATRWISAPAA